MGEKTLNIEENCLFTRSTQVRESLAVDANALQRILLPTKHTNAGGEQSRGRSYGEFFDNHYDYLHHLERITGALGARSSKYFGAHNRRNEKEVGSNSRPWN